jgi:hypothetical protein
LIATGWLSALSVLLLLVVVLLVPSPWLAVLPLL